MISSPFLSFGHCFERRGGLNRCKQLARLKGKVIKSQHLKEAQEKDGRCMVHDNTAGLMK